MERRSNFFFCCLFSFFAAVPLYGEARGEEPPSSLRAEAREQLTEEIEARLAFLSESLSGIPALPSISHMPHPVDFHEKEIDLPPDPFASNS